MLRPGIAPVSVIHVTIGSSLDKMTSADDFHILSVRNVLGLGAIIVAVLIPVGLKRLFRKEMSDLGDAETALAEEAMDTREVDVPAIDDAQPRRYQAVDSGVVLAGPSTGDPNLDISRKVAKGKGRAVQIITDIREDEAEESEHEVYDAGEAHAQTDNIMPRRAYRPVKGYGAIEAVEREQIEAGGPWWTFSRK